MHLSVWKCYEGPISLLWYWNKKRHMRQTLHKWAILSCHLFFHFHQNRSSLGVGSIHILSTFGKSQAETWDNTDEEGKRNGLTEVKRKKEPKSARTMRVTAWTTAGSSRVAQAHKWRKGFLYFKIHTSLLPETCCHWHRGQEASSSVVRPCGSSFTLAVKSCFLRYLRFGEEVSVLWPREVILHEAKIEMQSI